MCEQFCNSSPRLVSYRILFSFVLAHATERGAEKEEGRGQRILRRSHETRLHVRPPTSNSVDANDLSAPGAFFLLLFSLFLSFSRSPFSFVFLSFLPSLLLVRARAHPTYSRARNQFTSRDLRRDRPGTDHDLDPRHTHRRDKFRATIRAHTSAETRPLVLANYGRSMIDCDRRRSSRLKQIRSKIVGILRSLLLHFFFLFVLIYTIFERSVKVRDNRLLIDEQSLDLIAREIGGKRICWNITSLKCL